jgi:hypothetical protein
MWDFIDKAVYINLDHRQDRRDSMLHFFKTAGIPDEKVQRIPAVYTPYNGLIGCAKSHISALETAKQNKWKAVLIAEDDLEWINFDENYKKLEELVSTNTWDVCMLTGMFMKVNPPKIKVAVYTNCYIVQQHYYDTLIENMKEGLRLKEDTLQKEKFLWTRATLHPLYKHIYNIDVYWIHLQMRDNWIGVMPQMCKQILSYSDINKDVIQPPTGLFFEDEYSKYDIGIMDYFLKKISQSNQ